MTGKKPTLDRKSKMNDYRKWQFQVADNGERISRLDEKVTQMSEKRGGMDGKITRIAVSVSRLEGDMIEVRRDVSELKGLRGDFGRFQTVLDGMARSMKSLERWCRSHPQ